MKISDVKDLMAKIEVKKTMIAGHRDKLRELKDELTDLLDSFDRGIEEIDAGIRSFEDGIDALSEYV